ncbi:SsrA-binding protein SmpB [Tepidiforma sp.]|uniref:SsrA-binding protein SmpB n=1 Tax=Tepidiforma sp. TaxID=2682230 RepID=UPI0021DE75C4|nr:SsrA-binding protein SmpB [Tepidiforma sp.]MCX7616916.1 SsrA-binding protein SmpB [Tepidiforma sp.]GIW17361.1 MAG: SsrA-binding protein [Tepidiforma sp.]
MSDATIAQNRRARHDYEILARFEAGIVLTGSEIKSVRDHKVQFQGAYARIKDGEAWLIGAHIAPYANAGYAAHDPTRDRKLLLHKKEIRRIAQMVDQKGLTLIPLSMYFKRGKAKVELGVGRGRKSYDKREAVKQREQERAAAEALKRSVR